MKNAWLGLYIGAGILSFIGLYGIVEGNYLLTLILLGSAGVMAMIGSRERVKAKRTEFTEDNPHSTAVNAPLYDETILELLEFEQKIDPTNIQLANLQRGFTFDFNLKTWEVKTQFVDYWKTGERAATISKHSILDSGGEQKYLDSHKNALDGFAMMKEINIYTIATEMDSFLTKEESFAPPVFFNYDDKNYYREPKNEGLRIDTNTKTYRTLQAFTFLTKDRKHVLQINCLNGNDLEAFAGEMHDERLFAEILPSAQM